MPRQPVGAYGLRLTGPVMQGADPSLFIAVAEDAPTVTVTWTPDLEVPPIGVTDEVACTPLLAPEADQLPPDDPNPPIAGHVSLVRERRELTARYHVPERPEPDRQPHPVATTVAGLCASWLGRLHHHAGGLAVGDACWGVLGAKGAGKSTLLAALSLHGVPIVADDAIVVEDGWVHTGPRVVDLRPRAAALLVPRADPADVSRVRGGLRTRLRLPQMASRTRLKGWLILDWDDEISVKPVAFQDRHAALAVQRWPRVAEPDPIGVLEDMALPMLGFTRPQDPDRLDQGLDMLLAALD